MHANMSALCGLLAVHFATTAPVWEVIRNNIHFCDVNGAPVPLKSHSLIGGDRKQG